MFADRRSLRLRLTAIAALLGFALPVGGPAGCAGPRGDAEGPTPADTPLPPEPVVTPAQPSAGAVHESPTAPATSEPIGAADAAGALPIVADDAAALLLASVPPPSPDHLFGPLVEVASESPPHGLARWDPLLPATMPSLALDADDDRPIEDLTWSDVSAESAEDLILVIRRSDDEESGRILEWVGETRARVLARDELGRLVIEAAIDTDHDALTTYEPPLPILSPMQEWNGVERVSSVVRVERRSSPGTSIDGGEAQFASTVRGLQSVRLPDGGVHIALRIETRLDLTLRRARVSSQTISWMVPGIGPVAREEREQVRALGFLRWSRQARLIWRPSASAGG